MSRPVITSVLAFAACVASAVAGAEVPAWLAQSNQDANVLLEVQAKYAPEGASGLGVERYDSEVLDLRPRVVARESLDLRAVEARYGQLLKSETDPRVRDDLEILLKAAWDQRVTLELDDRLMLPYFDLPQGIYSSYWISAPRLRDTPRRWCACSATSARRRATSCRLRSTRTT